LEVYCREWIYNYLCNQCLSLLMLWVRISSRASSTTLCDKVCQWLATGRWFYRGPPVFSTNKTDRHDITVILLKVALKTIKQINIQTSGREWYIIGLSKVVDPSLLPFQYSFYKMYFIILFLVLNIAEIMFAGRYAIINQPFNQM
jgi:hypothetical protein